MSARFLVGQYAWLTWNFKLTHYQANVWNEPLASPALRVLKPGTLDDAGWARPVGNIWTDRALPWVPIDPGVPNFPGQPPSRQPLFDAYAAEIAKG